MVKDQLGNTINVGSEVKLSVKHRRPRCGRGQVNNGSIGMVRRIAKIDGIDELRLIIDFPQQCEWSGYGNEVIFVRQELCHKYNSATARKEDRNI